MTDPVSVLLIIGALMLGPYRSTPQDMELLKRWNVAVEQQAKPPPGANWRPLYWGLKEITCRRVMQDAGVTWRLAIDGTVGWIRGPKDWLGRETSVEFRCVVAPADYKPLGEEF